MRKLSEGEGNPKPSQKPVLTSIMHKTPAESRQIQRGF